MARLTVKGPNARFADSQADWDEHENLVDARVAFYDLRHLQSNQSKFGHPFFDDITEEIHSIDLPDKQQVINYLKAGNDLVIRLPTEEEFQLRGVNRDGEIQTYGFDPFLWLPIGINLDASERGYVVENDSSWDWYFDSDYSWEATFHIHSGRMNFGYPDPRPPQTEIQGELVTTEKPLTSVTTPPAYPRPDVEYIALNNVDDPLAAKVDFKFEEDDYISPAEGDIYLLTPHPSQEPVEFVRETAKRIFHFDLEDKPEWVHQYPIPGNNKLQEELQHLDEKLSKVEEEIEDAIGFRELLFCSGDVLETRVRQALSELDLNVSGEMPNGRDGAVEFEEEVLILEITGSHGGVSHSKIRQLEEHVDNAADWEDTDTTGLLIYNHYQDRNPVERNLNISNFKQRLEEGGCKVLTTIQLYRLLCRYEANEINSQNIEDYLLSDQTILHEESDPNGPTVDWKSRFTSLRERLRESL